ncbi:MAG: hypothetical protein NXI32_27480 [bacterium]|nr:hypothetical protein [bacterium]
MSYWRYWELEAPPFASEASRPLFRGGTFEEALARIEFLIANRRSFGLVTGETGSGKSSILRLLASNPPRLDDESALNVLRLSLLGLHPGEFVNKLASYLVGSRQWTQSGPTTTLSAWNCLDDYFRAASCENRHFVLLLDDGENATAEAELELSRLLAMAFPLTIVMAMDLRCVGTMSQSVLDQVGLQIELPRWEIDETVEFLAWSIARVGHDNPIFTDAAVDRIQDFSRGIPRKIIQLADLALVAGAVAGANCVDTDCIDQVAFELPRRVAA